MPPLNLTMLCIKNILGYFRETEGYKLEDWFYQTNSRLHSRFYKRQEQKYKCSKAIRGEELPNSPFCIPTLLPVSLKFSKNRNICVFYPKCSSNNYSGHI